MKKIVKNIFNSRALPTGFALLLLAVCSCKKFVVIGPPISEVESSKVFSNDQATVSAALGVYSNMGVSSLYICSGGSTLYPALSADELSYNSSNAELLSFQHDQVIANNGTGIYTRLWVPAYGNIYAANAILLGLGSSTGLSDSVKNQVEGEMLVVRSLNYFYLAGLFGDVPLELTPNYQLNSIMARTPVQAIYSQLVIDLKRADLLLRPAYPDASNTRPNKWTADALLARVYLYQGNWEAAIMMATAVISSGQYKLENDLENVFEEGSAETIWQLSSDYRNTAEAAAFVPSSSSAPAYSIDSALLAAFEPGDLRLADWIGKKTVNGHTYYYSYKYKNRAYAPVTEYEVIFRFAELYLIRAEAAAHLGELTAATADLDIIRSRAGLNGIQSGGQASLLKAVAAERQRELFCEWGHRWLDLKRTGMVDSVLRAEKPNYWQTAAKLYPIPAGELK